MEKIITYETLRRFAYSNDKLIKGDIRGIVLNFFGLGGMPIFYDDSGEAKEFAAQGVIFVQPYYNPWCWMNAQAVDFVDEIVSVLVEHYGLGDGVKVVSTGGSMGGLSALVYTAYARITPVACVANCPVCDLPYHFTEREDLPRTLYSAFGTFEGSMDEALRSRSPLHLVEKMPHVPYTIFHCEDDRAVNLEKHSLRFVEAMRPTHDVAFITVPLRGHCDLSYEAHIQYREAILRALL
ncbi:MAG: prolyl oligopeptidase family serine peptidase [Clostridia bacterium]|nr:prolyl oligopeptidase family serine peptidase [Clostridia bacterium]